MVTLGVYSSTKYEVELSDLIAHCCYLWGDPSPISYLLYGTETFMKNTNKWFKDSDYFCTNLNDAPIRKPRKGSYKAISPRKISPRLRVVIDTCSHVILFMHPNDEECFQLLKLLLKTECKVIAIKV